MNHHAQLVEMLKDLELQKPVFLPMMEHDQPDTAERKRLEMQRIPWALPAKRTED